MVERRLFLDDGGEKGMAVKQNDVSDDDPTRKYRRVTRETLQPGKRYRVIRSFADIEVGTVLCFRERMYFPYDAAWYLQFVTGEGEPISICENAHAACIAELDRYLTEEHPEAFRP